MSDKSASIERERQGRREGGREEQDSHKVFLTNLNG
jgi:hypothetical protein